MYFAIIGDIIHSKNLKDRHGIQMKLNHILNQINTEFEEDIAAKFIITLGDEFQGLLHSSGNILKIIDLIQFKLYPIRLRFGIGIGEIDTQIDRNMALGADGPAYHYARNMIQYLKMKEKGKLSGSANIMFYSGFHIEIITLINCNLQFCSYLERNWTDKQRELLEKMILDELNQSQAAKELQIAQSSIQRRLKAAGYFDYIHARTTITTILREKWGEYDGE